MKKYLKSRNYLSVLICGSVLGLVALSASCNKDFETKIAMHEMDSTHVEVGQQKVLYIIVDGLRGEILPQINPPALTIMADNGISTYNSVSAANGKDATTWADMLTGVSSDKHKVVTDDFSGNDLKDYPALFERLKQAAPNLKTAAFCSSDLLSENLTTGATINKSFNHNDEAVESALIDELKNDSASVVLGEFHGVEAAGEQYGFDDSSSEYVNAIMKVDRYIGAVMNALYSRKNIANENWLVVVASNKGGPATVPPDEQDNTIFSDPVLNSFIIFYNPDFSAQFVAKPNTANLPYTGYTIKMRDMGDDAINAYVPDDKGLYNFGSSGEYTVEFKIKVFNWGTVWPSFFGKRQDSYNSGYPGWIFMFHDPNNWRVILCGTNGSRKTFDVQHFGTEQWHTLTLKVYDEGDRRFAAIYTDGAKSDPMDITGLDISTDKPLTSGWIDGYTGTQSEFYLTDIKFWHTAIPDSTILAKGGVVGIDTTSVYYKDLIGYWPCTDGIGDKFKDYGPYHNDMVFNITDKNKSSFAWEKFSDLSALIHPPLPEGLAKEVPRGLDIPFMIYNWMNINPLSWNLDGRVWIPNYLGY